MKCRVDIYQQNSEKKSKSNEKWIIDLYCNINCDGKNIREQTIVIPVRSLTFIEIEKLF